MTDCFHHPIINNNIITRRDVLLKKKKNNKRVTTSVWCGIRAFRRNKLFANRKGAEVFHSFRYPTVPIVRVLGLGKMIMPIDWNSPLLRRRFAASKLLKTLISEFRNRLLKNAIPLLQAASTTSYSRKY